MNLRHMDNKFIRHFIFIPRSPSFWIGHQRDVQRGAKKISGKKVR